VAVSSLRDLLADLKRRQVFKVAARD